ncbi:MAG: hypothetical protein LBT00_15905 [Spirochaetaceae bacterium]|nr:hypothetical protein [Spirochaetaceae bacterium]
MAKKRIFLRMFGVVPALLVFVVSMGFIAACGSSPSSAQTQEQKPPEVVKDLGAYDTSWDDAEFCTLIIPSSVVVTSIDGSTVDWGLFQSEAVKVAIPAGSHTLLADYSHPLKLQSLDGTEYSEYNPNAYREQQERIRQAEQVGGKAGAERQQAVEILGGLFSMGKQAAADAKAKKIQQENERRIEEARLASNKNIEIYQRFAPGGAYTLEIVPNSAGPYQVRIGG